MEKEGSSSKSLLAESVKASATGEILTQINVHPHADVGLRLAPHHRCDAHVGWRWLRKSLQIGHELQGRARVRRSTSGQAGGGEFVCLQTQIGNDN